MRVGLLHTQVMIDGSRNRLASTQNGGHGLRIGLQVPRFTWPDASDSIGPKLAQIGEVGFASIWVMDHFFQIRGSAKPRNPCSRTIAPSTTWWASPSK